MAEHSAPQAKKAKKIPGESSSLLTEEQLWCSICLEVFADPVTTPCGHNFCKSCITQSWDKTLLCCCPLCNEKFTNRPELTINITLREVADHFKKKDARDKRDVLCDICTGEKEKAVKSCLDCAVTFCSSHLEPHMYVPNYKKHKLINAVKNLEEYRCQKHERPLELFCKDDQTCVCQFCAEGEHKNHKVIPLEEESGQKKTELQQKIQERLKKTQGIKHSVELSKRITEKVKPDSVEVFTALIRSIERSQAELLKKKQNTAEKQAEGFIKELEQEIDELKQLEQLSHTDDHLHLLQIYPSLCSALQTKNWSEIRINTDLNVDAVRAALSQLQKTLNEKFRETVSTDLQRIRQYAVDVTLDPDTANPFLILSGDRTQVTYINPNTTQNLQDTPKRFIRYPIVLGTQGFSSGRFYFQVQVSRKTAWDLGVVKESVNRKEKLEKCNPQDGFWAIILRNGKDYMAYDDPCIRLSPRETLQKVGVFVDYEEGLVSFYDVEARSHIHSFTGQSFTEKLYPYFNPGLNDSGKNTAPLIISRV